MRIKKLSVAIAVLVAAACWLTDGTDGPVRPPAGAHEERRAGPVAPVRLEPEASVETLRVAEVEPVRVSTAVRNASSPPSQPASEESKAAAEPEDEFAEYIEIVRTLEAARLLRELELRKEDDVGLQTAAKPEVAGLSGTP